MSNSNHRSDAGRIPIFDNCFTQEIKGCEVTVVFMRDNAKTVDFKELTDSLLDSCALALEPPIFEIAPLP